MMKKILTLLLALCMLFSLVACGSKKQDDTPAQPSAPAASSDAQTDAPNDSKEDAQTDSKEETPDATNEDVQNAPQDLNDVETLFHPATSADTGAYATIKISPDVQMDDESAWLGLCPAGTDYITEEEADEVDVIWFNYDYREEGDPYVYACDFSSVEDGTYALVVASSDDANVGYVMIQLTMTKEGEKLTFDYTDAKFNERPVS